jgi:hypothetical protein
MGKRRFVKLACSALKANGINRLVGQSEILTLNFTLAVAGCLLLLMLLLFSSNHEQRRAFHD